MFRRLALAVCLLASPAEPLSSQQPTGTTLVESFFSPALGVYKHLLVYLPPSYDRRRDRRYPVIYYLHGVSGTEADWLTNGEIDRVADSLIARGVPPMILALVDGDDGWATNWAATPDYQACLADSTAPWRSQTTYCVHTARYEDYMLQDVIPFVDRTFRTKADFRHRGVAGYSMGGYSAVVLALAHPDVFGAAVSHSGALSLLYAGPRPFVPPPRYETASDSLAADHQLAPVFGTDAVGWLRRDPAHLARLLHDWTPHSASLSRCRHTGPARYGSDARVSLGVAATRHPTCICRVAWGTQLALLARARRAGPPVALPTALPLAAAQLPHQAVRPRPSSCAGGRGHRPSSRSLARSCPRPQLCGVIRRCSLPCSSALTPVACLLTALSPC